MKISEIPADQRLAVLWQNLGLGGSSEYYGAKPGRQTGPSGYSDNRNPRAPVPAQRGPGGYGASGAAGSTAIAGDPRDSMWQGSTSPRLRYQAWEGHGGGIAQEFHSTYWQNRLSLWRMSQPQVRNPDSGGGIGAGGGGGAKDGGTTDRGKGYTHVPGDTVYDVVLPHSSDSMLSQGTDRWFDPGFEAGASYGGLLGGVVGTILGGPVGGLVGGFVGGLVGGFLGQAADRALGGGFSEMVYNTPGLSTVIGVGGFLIPDGSDLVRGGKLVTKIGAKVLRESGENAAENLAKRGLGGAGRNVDNVAGGGGTGSSFRSYSAFKRAMGPAGEGMRWHHIVEQTPGNLRRFGPEMIHNTRNITPLDIATHRRLSAYYSSIHQERTGSLLTVRKWLSTHSFEDQLAFGQRALENFRKGGWQ